VSVFDGTLRPSVGVKMVDGEIPYFYDTQLIEWSVTRGKQKRLEPLTYGTLMLVFDNRDGTFDNVSAGWACRLYLNTLATAMLDLMWTPAVFEVKQVRGLNPVTIVEARDDAWLCQKTYLDAEYLNANGTELSGVRVSRVSPAGVFDGGYPGTTSMLASFGGMNALQALQQCANVEAGAFHVLRDGGMYLARANEKLARTVKLAFSDVAGANNVPYQAVTMVPGNAYLVNQVTVNRPSRTTSAGQATKATYEVSTGAYGVKGQQWSAPVYLDDSAQALATYLARIAAEPADTVDFLEFTGVDFLRNATTLTYDDLITLEMGDRVTVTRSGTTYDCVVEGLKHIGNPRSWQIRLYLSPYNDYTVDIAAGLTSDPGVGTFVYATPADWTVGAATDTVRPATSLDIKWRDFADRGGATGTLDLYANAKQEVVYDANSTGAYQFDCKGGSATAMPSTLDVGQCVEFDVLVKCNNVTHVANAVVLVDGSATGVTTIWLGGAPATGTVGQWDRYKLKVYLVNGTPTYRVVAQREASA
jgi:hypothetical protein